MKLYHGIPSVCSIKVRIALAEIGLEYESVEMNLQAGVQHEPEYLELNPAGVVPTLIDEDLVVLESSLIIEYLDRVYNKGRFMPRGPAAEVEARHWLLRCIDIHAAINTLSFSTVMRDSIVSTKSPAEIEEMLAKMPDPVARMKRKGLFDNGVESGYLRQALLVLARTFKDMDVALAKGDWVSGAEFGISDIALVAYVDRLDRLGFEGLYNDANPRIAEWLERMQARPSFKAEVIAKIPASQAEKMKAGGAKFAAGICKAYAEL